MLAYISRRTLLSCLKGAENVYPSEFLGLLRGIVEPRGVVVKELVLAPLAEYEETHSAFSPWLVPTDPSIIGSFHSHPSPAPWGLKPSKADLRFFSQNGKIHLIACLPYSPETTAAYDWQGKKAELRVE